MSNEQQNPTSALKSTTITHPTPTQNPAEQTVPGDDDAQDEMGQAEGSDWDEDLANGADHEDVGSSADAPAGAADGDDLEQA